MARSSVDTGACSKLAEACRAARALSAATSTRYRAKSTRYRATSRAYGARGRSHCAPSGVERVMRQLRCGARRFDCCSKLTAPRETPAILADEGIVQFDQGDRTARRELEARRIGHTTARSCALHAAKRRPYHSVDTTTPGQWGSIPANERSRSTTSPE